MSLCQRILPHGPCSKPTWDGNPGYCSMDCQHWSSCHLERCNKPSWNGREGDFCCVRCKNEAAPQPPAPVAAPQPDSGASPSQRPNHQRLGIRICDAEWFVRERVEFPQKYVRDEGRCGWITRLHGNRLTGLDLQVAITSYMQRIGSSHLSVCELALSEGNWASKSFEPGQAVGDAAIVGSHVQLEAWEETVAALKDGLEYAAQMRMWSTYVFLDYFSVRPLEASFNMQTARARVEGVGRTLAVLPQQPLEYLTNAHCLFECVATVKSGGQLCVHMSNDVYDKRDTPFAYVALKRQFDIGINARAAKCTNERDNAILQGYFGGVGEDYADKVMKDAVFAWMWDNGGPQLERDGIKKEYWEFGP